MAGWTNKGKYRSLGVVLRGESAPTNFYLALVTEDNVPDADTNTMSDLTEIADGNGYTSGGQIVSRDSGGFDSWVEEDVVDEGQVQLSNFTWRATLAGTIPASGNPIRYAVLTDDDPVVGDREVWYYWDLGQGYTISPDQSITFVDLEIRIGES